MAIYPDKNAKGELTGRYRVEVQKNGGRLRDRCDSLAAAKLLEVQFQAQLSGRLPMPPKAPKVRKDQRVKGSVSTIAAAVDLARGKLWKGLASETDMFAKLSRLITILGGDTELDDINLHSLDKIIHALESEQRTGATINRYLSCYNTFLKWCLSREYRTKALPKLEWHKESEGRIRWLEDHEEEALEALLDHDSWVVVRTAIVTGMRQGELLGLTSDRVEWLAADECGWARLWDTKNGTPRSVPLSLETYEDLKYLTAGRMPDAQKLTRAWNRARKAMGLTEDPWFVFHCTRHTCATRLVQANVNLAVVKEYMGHKTIETTLRYAHVNATSLTDALKTLKAHRAPRLVLVKS